MVEALSREARASIEEQVERFEVELERYTRRLVIKTLRTLAVGAAAITLIGAGLILSLYGTATYLGQFTAPGISWVIIGVIGAGIGTLVLILMRNR